ncbi:hypothetical protein LTR56_024016 [Elasticomyces elasticus]|nr:hypothetical protein LTR56_024016 [Elasticomyces elasticus]KAK3661021.1 hypothetical protein LTR22_007646 [Elasticomyces elasticus]KAK4906132.1 hypothetical protein LTR49_024681 [Elasticomyces elasticus]KAK5744274.1 hypothetical protein LTS12_023547 [Elasticomyces elasticus]
METITPASSLYTPLKRWQIRILRLSAGLGDDALSGDLLVADVVHMEGLALHDEGELVAYEAISYTWGRPTLTGAIIVNGYYHSITPTLESALKHFRHHDKARYLWVGRSREILSIQADSYLGAYEILWTVHGSAVCGYSKKYSQRVRRRSTAVRTFSLLRLITDAAEMLYDLKSEASRTWWTSNLDTACSNVRNLAQASVEKTVQLELIRSLGEAGADHLMPYPNPAPSMRLDSVLLRTKDLMATDPRDKIYALLPLSGCRVSTMHGIKRSLVPAFLVDYKRPLAVVYQDLTKYIINRDRSLYVLQALRFQSGQLQTVGALQLPTWTPDWSDLTAYEKHRAVSASLSSDQAQRSFPVPWQHTAEVGILHVNGVFMGSLHSRVAMSKEQISILTEHARASSDPSTWDSMMYTVQPNPAHSKLDRSVKPGASTRKPDAWMISEGTLALGDDEVPGELVLNHRAEIGDLLVVLDDIRRPVVLRRTGNDCILISTVVQVMLFGNNVDIGWQYMHALYDCVLGQRLAVRQAITLR